MQPSASSANSPILWRPTESARESSQMLHFARRVLGETGQIDYRLLAEWSTRNRDAFWLELIQFLRLRWEGSSEPVCLESGAFHERRFFPNIRLNYAENLVANFPNDQPVLVGLCEEETVRRVWQKPATIRAICGVQHQLKKAGVQAGDRVAAVLPNSPEAVIAMLATVGLGASWSSCSPDFGEEAITDRLAQITPKFLFLADRVLYHGKTFDLAEKNRALTGRLPSVLATHTFLQLAGGEAEALNLPESDHDQDPIFVRQPFDHSLFLMFSSGTTGKPKCLIHGAGGTLLQHLKELRLHCNLGPEDRFLYYTTCGWMMWNWAASSLATGATLYCYDGSPAIPEKEGLWTLAARENLTVLGTSARFISTCRKANMSPKTQLAGKPLRLVLSTGSPLYPADFDYFYDSVAPQAQLSSISGGTDIISCFMLGNPLSPVRRGEIQGPGLGMDIHAYNQNGQSMIGREGELVCASPFPSMPVAFWNDPEGKKYEEAYFQRFPNIWTHGDFVTVSEDGGIVVHGRSDATLNPGGVRIGTAEIYRQIEGLPEIADSLAVGRPVGEDEEVLLFVKLSNNQAELTPELEEKIRQRIRAGASPRHVPKTIYAVPDIPYTTNAKKVEIAVKQILRGRNPENVGALANPESLDYFIAFAQSDS